MQSNGGSLTVAAAQDYPVRMITSGPAGGALAVQRIGKASQHVNLLGVGRILGPQPGHVLVQFQGLPPSLLVSKPVQAVIGGDVIEPGTGSILTLIFQIM